MEDPNTTIKEGINYLTNLITSLSESHNLLYREGISNLTNLEMAIEGLNFANQRLVEQCHIQEEKEVKKLTEKYYGEKKV